jgi:hypothetical protein
MKFTTLLIGALTATVSQAYLIQDAISVLTYFSEPGSAIHKKLKAVGSNTPI